MEHKYKKDEFLRNKISGNICKIKWDTSFIDENIWEAWKPKYGELCWFWNTGDKYPTLSRLVQINNYDGYFYDDFNAETPWYKTGDEFDNYAMQESYVYKFCQPITKNLPFNLDKQK